MLNLPQLWMDYLNLKVYFQRKCSSHTRIFPFIFWKSVRCSGNENTLYDCPHYTNDSHPIHDHKYDIGVACSEWISRERERESVICLVIMYVMYLFTGSHVYCPPKQQLFTRQSGKYRYMYFIKPTNILSVGDTDFQIRVIGLRI